MVPAVGRCQLSIGCQYSNHVSICSDLAAIISGKFQAISGHISETVSIRPRLILITNKKWHTL